MINYPLPRIFIKQTPMHTPRPRYIIMHNSLCLLENKVDPKVEIDMKKYQFDWIKKLHIADLKLSDLNYHFIVDKISGDYEVLVGRPLQSPCIFEDIDDIYFYAIHIAVMGNYNIDMADKRLYDVIAYRIITPLMYWFHLDKNLVKTHSEVSNDKDINCPGEYFFKEILLDSVSKYTSGK